MKYFGTDIDVMLGDQVEVRWRFRWRKGTVCHVHDPSKPSPIRGDNPHGFGIRLPDGSVIGYYRPDKKLRFLSRGEHRL